MRRLILLTAFVLGVCNLFAQAPDGFKYQALIRDSNGEILSEQSIALRISIIQGSASGTSIFSERHISNTNKNGLVNLIIGQGTPVSGTFSSIPWGNDLFFLKLEMDPEGGNSYTEMGTSQLLSVPYALYSEQSKTVDHYSSDTLFVVKDNQGNVVFAVFPDGAKVYVNDTSARGPIGGFAVSGRNNTKGEYEVMRVTPDSTRIFVNESNKGPIGGFAVSGRNNTKNKQSEYEIIRVTPDSTNIYINQSGKGPIGGFAVSGRNNTKDSTNEFFNVSGNASAEIINPSEPRILWYPLKEAFLTGRVLVESPDSVGTNSFSSGFESKSIGNFSQAMGYKTRAVGINSTAIGNNANALGHSSFALGDNAIAKGIGSYAIGSVGRDTITGSALGNPVYAAGNHSIAVGLGARSDSLGSVAMGINTRAANKFSTAIGFFNTATGIFSTALGKETNSDGYASTTIGWYNMASGKAATSIGWETNATGLSSIALNSHTTASGDFSTAMGHHSTAEGWSSYVAGHTSHAIGHGSFAMGQSVSSIGNGSFAIGNASLAEGVSSFAIGLQSNAIADESLAIGTRDTTKGWNSIAIGYENVAEGYISTAMGRDCYAVGDYSFAMGHLSEANGNKSFALGYLSYSGPFAFAAGSQAKASGGGSVAIGQQSESIGFRSYAFGKSMKVGGDYSFGIALNDWYNNDTLNQNNTMAIVGGIVGIGTLSPDKMLHVAGNARIEGDIFYSTGTNTYDKPDYVFNDAYSKKYSIEEISEFIDKNGCLPWLTPNNEEKNGINFTRMGFETLEAVENIQLQVIKLKKENDKLKKQVEKQKNMINQLIDEFRKLNEK